MFQELLTTWQAHRGLTSPPQKPILLWQGDFQGIGVSEKWGPAVPYLPVKHEDGSQNHGYVRIKGSLGRALEIPEAIGWPELQALLLAVNEDESPVESVGCEKSYFAATIPGGPPVQLGSYIHLLFTESVLNDVPENLLLLASQLVNATEGCSQWWSGIEIEVERFRGVSGAVAPWGLLLRIIGYGRDENEARRGWGETCKRITASMAKLPRDYRWRDNTHSGEAA